MALISSGSGNSISVRHLAFIFIGLWAANILLYFPSLQFGFINFDDFTVLLNHPDLYNEKSFVSSIQEIFFTAFPREEPLLLRDVTWALDSYIWGFKNPFGYHLGNVILNSFNGALLWLFLYLTTRKALFAFTVSSLFTVLPVHVEPVCWVMGRKDLLVTFFMLTGLILQTIGLETNDEHKRRIFYLLTIAITLAALLSKINALTYFAVLALHRFFYPYLKGSVLPETPLNLTYFWKQVLPKYIPHLVISLLIFLWYRQILSTWGVLDRGVDSLSVYHFKNFLLFTPIIFILYLKLIFFPYGHSILYHWPTIHQPLTYTDIALSVVAALGIVLFSIFLFKKWKDLLFYWIAFWLLMFPYLNIMYIGIWITNRYIYFSLFCILAIVSKFLIQIIQKQSTFVKGMVVIVFIGYISLNIFQTCRYQQVWRSDLALWKYETNLKHPSLMAMASLAGVYINMGKKASDVNEQNELYARAERLVEKGLAIFEESELQETTPHLFRLYYNKGLLAQLKGAGYDRQLTYYRKAYKLKPKQPDVIRKMAEVYYRMALEATDTEKRRILATHSFQYFSRYVDLIHNDPLLLQRNLVLLQKTYEVQFRFLSEDITVIKNKLSGLINQSITKQAGSPRH